MSSILRGPVFLMILSSASLLGGCAPRDEVGTRLSSTLDHFEHVVRFQRDFPLDYYSHARILAQLRRATASSLRVPELCLARAWRYDEGGYIGLVVYWIEDQPTPEELYLLGDRDSEPIALTMDELQRASNWDESKAWVMFNATFLFPFGSEAALRVQDSRAAHVVLVRAGRPVSNVLEVDRSRVGDPLPGTVQDAARETDDEE